MDPRAQRILDETRKAGFDPPAWMQRLVVTAVARFGHPRTSSLHDVVRRLPFWSRVRNAVEAHVGGGPDCFPVLVDTLLDGARARRREKQAAARALALLEPEGARRDLTIELLSQIVSGEVTLDYRRIRRCAVWGSVRGGIVFGAIVAVALAGTRVLLWLDPSDMLVALGTVAATVAGAATLVVLPLALLSAVSDSRAPEAAVQASASGSLAQLPSALAVPALARGALTLRAPAREAARTALDACLPCLSSDHYGEVGAACVRDLCRMLGKGSEERDLALIEALGKVGGGSAVGPVMDQVRIGKTVMIRKAAEGVLPILQARQDQEKLSQRLVRPASSAPFGERALLRPVRVGEVDTDRLVRAAAGAESGETQAATTR